MNMPKKDVLKGRSIVNKGVFEQANQSIDEIKRNNPLSDYFKSKGVDLKPSGNGQYMGLCPFHDDHNPSLSVNTDKNVFKCFGCGKSGTIIDAVSLFDNLTTGEAIRKLQGKQQKINDKPFHLPTGKREDEENQADDDLIFEIPKTEELVPSEVEVKPLNLNEVINFYHKKLYENHNSIEYLKSRCITTPELLQRFKIGFADGSLLNIIGENQRKELTEAGIINQYGYEAFNNCLIFPIFDDNENTIGIYGRNIDDGAKVKHLYLKGKHKGAFNRKTSKIYDEIILTESIIDCLSLIELGFQNVQSIYGVNGFTDEHLQILKDDRVKTIIIAFDNDSAGITASETIKKKLINENISVKIISPPVKPVPSGVEVKDWNEELINGIIKDEIQSLIDNADIFQQENDNLKDFSVKRDKNNYVFYINGIVYNIFDVKELAITNLKVSIKAEYQGERFPDRIDLYSSRSRNSFSITLSQRFNIEAKRIEKDLLQIIDYLEAETMKLLNPKTDKKEELSEEDIKTGMEFLKSDDLFKQIVNDMEVLGYAGEETNKLLVYLAGVSRLMSKPLSVFIQSAPSAGKSYLLETYMKLLPEESVKWISSFSDQSFNYLEQEEFLDKIFMVGEALHNEIVEGHIRQMQSENKISRMVVSKDPKTGILKTIEVKNSVRLSFMMTSTALRSNIENMSRCIVTHVDESAEQTAKIHEMQRHKGSFEGYLEEKNLIPIIIKKHKSAQRLLNKVRIFNPFLKYLRFPTNRPIYRRGQQQFIALIDSICILRQKQKEEIEKTDFYTGEKENGIECDLFDYELARKLFIDGRLLQGSDDIPAGLCKLYDTIRKMVKTKAKEQNLKPEDITFIQTDVREITELSGETVKRYIRMLVDYEYLQVIGGKRHGTKFSYKLREDKSIEKIDVSSIIPTGEEVKKLIEEDKEN